MGGVLGDLGTSKSDGLVETAPPYSGARTLLVRSSSDAKTSLKNESKSVMSSSLPPCVICISLAEMSSPETRQRGHFKAIMVVSLASQHAVKHTSWNRCPQVSDIVVFFLEANES